MRTVSSSNRDLYVITSDLMIEACYRQGKADAAEAILHKM